jgi:hypothetical protein
MSFLLKPGTRINGTEVDLVLDRCVPEDPSKGYVPAYNFFIMLHATDTKIGHLHLRIGATFIETLKAPEDHEIFQMGESYKSRFLLGH